ncbi:MAG TPA: Trk system potassium transporter TrkA [Rhodospirillaceae bacterium]|nr:MAG: hypothetical protein A2018_04210 [Alphaproteobacteria bacterium GWF2_58_20]HAU28724.1 Trk system potassium transporter TrkA [Rhodospirillaceae bacterium]
MKILICGGGDVGESIARYLSTENISVSIIDTSPELVQRLNDTLDVTAFAGHAAHPATLELAGAAAADLLVAATSSDEVNLVACHIARHLFKTPVCIARVNDPSYLGDGKQGLFNEGGFAVDDVIFPAREIAQAFLLRLKAPGAQLMIPLSGDRIRLYGVLCAADCPLVGTPLRQLAELFPDIKASIGAIRRGEHIIIPSGEDMLMEGDEAYFAVASEHAARAMATLGHQEILHQRFIILGGGDTGFLLAGMIHKDFPGARVTLIESSRTRAEFLAQRLPFATIIHGDGLEPTILMEAAIDAGGTFIATTPDDENNVLASLLAKRMGAERAIPLIEKTNYNPLVTNSGIDAVVNPRTIISSKILQFIRTGSIRAVHALTSGSAEVFEGEVQAASPLAQNPIRDLHLSGNVRVAAFLRQGNVILARPNTEGEEGDIAIVFAARKHAKTAQKLFGIEREDAP